MPPKTRFAFPSGLVSVARTALHIVPHTRRQHQFSGHKVTLLKADWTQYDPEITRQLAAVNRSGVPTYVIYPADAKAVPDVLPELLTKDIVLTALKKDVNP